MKVALLVGLGALLLLVPFLPGIRELRRPKDDEPIRIDETFTRDPRYFGNALRQKLAPFLEERPPELPARMEIELRKPEILAVFDDLHVPEGAREDALAVALGAAAVGRDARLAETWVRGDAELESGAVVRALACDGQLTLGAGAKIQRWVDVEGHLLAEPGADLGLSASAAGVLRLSQGCAFRRLWGRPVFVRGEPGQEPAESQEAAAAPETIEDEVIWGRRGLSLPRGFRLERDLVALTDVRIGPGATVLGTIKAHGSIDVGDGARIRGNLIARRGVTTGRNVRVAGNVFAERDVVLGPGTQVGRKGGIKTVYAAGHIRLEPAAAVLGWVIAERGGTVGS